MVKLIGLLVLIVGLVAAATAVYVFVTDILYEMENDRNLGLKYTPNKPYSPYNDEPLGI
jgi:hypothetical protein